MDGASFQAGHLAAPKQYRTTKKFMWISNATCWILYPHESCDWDGEPLEKPGLRAFACKTGLFGAGLYFAENSSKSDEWPVGVSGVLSSFEFPCCSYVLYFFHIFTDFFDWLTLYQVKSGKTWWDFNFSRLDFVLIFWIGFHHRIMGLHLYL